MKVSANHYLYTVYDNRTGFPIAVNMTSHECAEKMGLILPSFYSTVTRSRQGLNGRWTIYVHGEDDLLISAYYRPKANLPEVMRMSRLAKYLQTSQYFAIKMCNKLGVTIFRAGLNNIRMVSRDEFFEKLHQANEENG